MNLGEQSPLPVHRNFRSLMGHRFERLVVVEYAGKRGDRHSWKCRCDCGEEVVVLASNLKRGNTRSCGCLWDEACRTHGKAGTPEYKSWIGMIHRCNDKSHQAWQDYGGRGITVCERWLASFEAFLEDMGPRPRGKTLDRINNNGGYDPGNCKWSSATEQLRNRRTSRIITVDGCSRCLSEWAELVGIDSTTIFGRLKRGWSEHDALHVPVNDVGQSKRRKPCRS